MLDVYLNFVNRDQSLFIHLCFSCELRQKLVIPTIPIPQPSHYLIMISRVKMMRTQSFFKGEKRVKDSIYEVGTNGSVSLF